MAEVIARVSRDRPVADVLRRPTAVGRPLADQPRRTMERALGHDFRSIRIFESDAAADIGANAFANGEQIHFAPGRYRPGTPAGDELLAHELTHIVQQRQGRTPGRRVEGPIISVNRELEREARNVGGSRPPTPKATSAAPGREGAPSGVVQADWTDQTGKTHPGDPPPGYVQMNDNVFGTVWVPGNARRRGGARAAPPPPVPVGVSHRPGFGYDAHALEGPDMAPTSLPAGFQPLARNASPAAESAPNDEVRLARAAAGRADLDAVNGLYIPGGHDVAGQAGDRASRVAYELALIREARNRGMPTLAICGGSRVLAEAYGGQSQALDDTGVHLHSRRGTAQMAHSLTLEPATILGGAARRPAPGQRPTVDSINSTHERGVAHANGQLNPINRLDGPRAGANRIRPRPADQLADSELTVSAWGPDGHPEGFESRFGAPMVGVTSHPEAIYRGSRLARDNATDQGRQWSDNVMRGFAQSMRAYAARRAVNAEIRRGLPRLRPPKKQ